MASSRATSYPRNVVKSVGETPGRGEDVIAITNAIRQAPVPMDQNAV
jgi:hypothetical protein